MQFAPTIVLALIALLNLGRGAFHVFAPDSGAGSVAGLDLSTNAQAVIFLLASVGVSQFVWGVFQAYVVLRQRAFVIHALALQTLLTGLGLANMIWWKAPPVTVPGERFNIIIFAVLVAALIVALATRRNSSRPA